MVRSDSPSAVPPGSRVSRTSIPLARSAEAVAVNCVLLPLPSMPSNVMKRPRIGSVGDRMARLGCSGPGSGPLEPVDRALMLGERR